MGIATETICKTRIEAAKRLRLELKLNFPGIKFSVRSTVFSGGDDISVHWDNGPTTEQVDKVALKYELGKFDGMTDMYNYDETFVADKDGKIKSLGGVKYVITQRNVDEELVVRVCGDLARLRKDAEYITPETRFFQNDKEKWDNSYHHTVRKIINKTDLSKGYHGIIHTEITCGFIEEMYKII